MVAHRKRWKNNISKKMICLEQIIILIEKNGNFVSNVEVCTQNDSCANEIPKYVVVTSLEVLFNTSFSMKKKEEKCAHA